MKQEQPFDFSRETETCATLQIDWGRIDNKTILITGATGMVGKYLIDVLLYRNRALNKHTRIIAVGRNREKFSQRFPDHVDDEDLVFLQADIQQPLETDEKPDMIIHMASNTHPRLYASDPIGTEMSNILGTYHLLNLAAQCEGCRFVFTSSGDVYGDNRSGKSLLDEKDCGYIDCNTLRAGYIEGKRASEALCNAYKEAKGIDFVTARLCRIYGPTMQLTDSKAISQFITKAAKGEDIVLKSKGTQRFSYLYIHDVVTALLYIMTAGKNGEAYNVADNDQTCALKDLAGILAGIGGKSVKYDIPDELEAKGASTFQDVCMDATKLRGLGWRSAVTMEEGLVATVRELKKQIL